MGFFRDYKYSTTQVTATCVDTTGGNFVWLAFANEGTGSCLLVKASATNLNQVYYTVVVPVSSINAMVIANGYIFLAVTHSTIFSIAYSISAPLTTLITFNKPSDDTESPIALTVGASNIYYLTPGTGSGQWARIVGTDFFNIQTDDISLSQSGVVVNNAISISVDATNTLWVITNGAPGYLIRAYFIGSWHFTETALI